MKQAWKLGKLFSVILLLFGLGMDYLTPKIPYSFAVLASVFDFFIVNWFVSKSEEKGQENDLNGRDQIDYTLYKSTIQDNIDEREKDLYIKPKFNSYLKAIIGIIVLPFILSFTKGYIWG